MFQGNGSKRGRGNGEQPEGKIDVEDLAVKTAQLVSMHDVRIRELGALIPQVRVPRTSEYGKALMEVDGTWKKDLDVYTKAKNEGAGPKPIGSKHVRVGFALLTTAMADNTVSAEEKAKISEKYQGNVSIDVLETDVAVAKWRVAKDGKNGFLEFKMTTGLEHIEATLLKAVCNNRGTRMQGIAPKGARARALDEVLSGTWRT